MDKNKKQLNVLSISSYGFNLGAGGNKDFSGAARRQMDYAKFLDKYIIIAPGDGKEGGPRLLANNLLVYPVKAKNQFLFAIKAYFLADKIIKKENINCLSCDNPFLSGLIGVFLKKKFNLPLITHSMAEMIDNKYYIKERRINRAKNWLAKRILKQTDILRVSTEAEIKVFEGKGYNKNKFHYAPFYGELDEFEKIDRNEDFREKIQNNKYDNIVLNVSRLAKQKDIPTMLKAAKIVIKTKPNTLFVLIGGGPLLAEVKKQAKAMGVAENIKITGPILYSDVKKYFKISDIFVITSIYEGTCMVLHEAAICKLPIVATAFAGARDFVADSENGFQAEIKDHKTIADKIIYLLDHREEAKKMGENGYERVKKMYNKDFVLKKYKELFIKAIEKHEQ